MKKENIEKDIKNATNKLLLMARSHSWNLISDNCLYITSEIQDSDTNFFEFKKIRKCNNEKKAPNSLVEILIELNSIYENLYDVNLYVYKALSKVTIVEIQYYPKSSLDKDYFEKVKNNLPMLHIKVSLPPYYKENEKFDIHWRLGGLRHEWKFFWWQYKVKKEIRRNNMLAQRNEKAL